MNSFRKMIVPLGLLSVALATTPAPAQSLLERLLMGERVHQGGNAFPPPPARSRQAAPAPAPAPAARKIVRVSGPSYYTYKTDALKPLDFSPRATASIATEEAARADGRAEDGKAAAFLNSLGEIDIHAEAEIGAALNEFYASHADFIWLEDGKPNRRAIDALRTLGEADRFGLDPADYAISLPAAEKGDNRAGQRDHVRLEMALSARVLRYVLDARNGRVVPDRLSGYHDLPRKEVDLPGTLRAIAHLDDVRTYLESRHPQNEYYRALRRELELLRASPDDGAVAIDRSALIKPGQSHPDFPAILDLIERKSDEAFRQRFGELLAAGRQGQTYAPELVPAVKAVQQAHGLSADGVIGPRTLAVLAGETRESKLERVELALERLRWLPSELGDPHVFINVPAFRVTYRENGRDRLSMRAIVGSRANQTYFFHDRIQQVDFHPYWGVPQSILVNEMLPRLHRDPSYLDRSGYEVFGRDGRRVSSAAVDWWRYDGKVPFDVRQKPGPTNALGELKILFPNRHAIYMHDTPDRSLFNRDMRALSHGCVRLEQPRAMAAAVLGWDEADIEKRLQGGHSSERVTAHIPVYIAYFTAWPDADGTVSYHGDIYDRDAHLRAAMDATSQSRQVGS